MQRQEQSVVAARPGRRHPFKRSLDLALSGLALAGLSPVLGALWIAVAIAHGRPVLFAQMRPGAGGKPFRMYKFRTMTNATDAHGNLLSDEKRLTAFGNFLRRSSLDELPELINVLKGEMSLVGPRPLLMQYLPLYTAEQARRHEVRPGITGWAQINGRNSLEWEQKFQLDVWDVDNQSMSLDLKILMLTVLRVLNRSDISSGGHATMPPFTGSS